MGNAPSDTALLAMGLVFGLGGGIFNAVITFIPMYRIAKLDVEDFADGLQELGAVMIAGLMGGSTGLIVGLGIGLGGKQTGWVAVGICLAVWLILTSLAVFLNRLMQGRYKRLIGTGLY